MSKILIGQLAGLITLSAYIPYIISILKKKTRPNRASWWIWVGVSVSLLASYWASGARDTLWLLLGNISGQLAIALLSIKYGQKGHSQFDVWCLFLAGASLIVWYLTGSPVIALVMNVLGDFIGYLPTIKKTYLNPGGEDKLTWLIFVVGVVLSFFAIEQWTFKIYIYPVMIFIGDATMLFLVIFKRSNH